jgi:hypothetical protein
MLNRKRAAGAVLGLCLLAYRPGSEAEAAKSPTLAPAWPASPPELKGLDYFRGTWVCTGVIEPTPTSAAHLTRGKAVYKWDLGNFFQSFTNQDDRTLDDPTPRWNRGFLGYDAEAKEFSLGIFFVGGARVTATSPGWAGNVLTFVGELMLDGKRIPTNRVITRKTDTEYFAVVENRGADGNMTKVFHEKCIKSGK